MPRKPPADTPASRLRAVRLRLGLTTYQAAKTVGIAQSSWAQMESGRTNPTLDRLLTLAGKLGVDPAELSPNLASMPPIAT